MFVEERKKTKAMPTKITLFTRSALPLGSAKN
jgi:hypothetical protein